MPCFHPLQAKKVGKEISFPRYLYDAFMRGLDMSKYSGYQPLPCGRCMGCRVERSRQWGVRMSHEAQLYEDNIFVTLTFDDFHLKEMCPNGSLNKKHVQDFVKRLRRKYDDRRIRIFYCGEYGDQMGRPHYHLCIFNHDFDDKKVYKSSNGFTYYNSASLSSLWPFGHAVSTDFSFDTACYVARYVTKKFYGADTDKAVHYLGREPEFAHGSNKPGIGRDWLDKFGMTDCWLQDMVVVNGYKSKPPRYYDKILEKIDPGLYLENKSNRILRSQENRDDSTLKRLEVREKCFKARISKLVRTLDKEQFL